jgi:hypothetical protein
MNKMTNPDWCQQDTRVTVGVGNTQPVDTNNKQYSKGTKL